MKSDKQEFIEAALNKGVGVVETDAGLLLVSTGGDSLGLIEYSHNNNIDWLTAYEILDSAVSPYSTQDKTITTGGTQDTLIIYTDGGSRGNPGPSASGFVIMDGHENIIEEGGEYLGITTNNQAEYQAVRTALELAYKYNPKKIFFRIDSLLVVNQMIGKFKIKNKDLWPINSAIHRLIDSHDAKVEFTHVRREFNKLADQKVNEVLDARKD